MKFQKVISGAVCMAVAVSSMSALGAVVADAVNLENVVPINASDSDTALGSGTLENGLEYEVYEDHVKITDCDESAEGEMIIPETIEGLPVTSIGIMAFYDCSALKSVTIPDNVTSIGGNAFNSCSSLTSITIPDSVTNIGGNAFSNCSALESITIPDSVTSIEGGAFRNCSALESITIPGSVTSIGGSAFNSCSSLTSIVSPLDKWIKK